MMMAGSSVNNKRLNLSGSRYPSRQKKLGPAPFASFEDLEGETPNLKSQQDDGESDPNSQSSKLPEIKEDGIRSPVGVGGDVDNDSDNDYEEDKGRSSRKSSGRSRHQSAQKSKASFASGNFPFSQPTSGPASALQTPSTPRIDISCASSSTDDSSNSEKQFFIGGLGLEDGTEDLRSSTEELPVGSEDEFKLEESARLRREKEREREEESRRLFSNNEELLRRASHPANIFTQMLNRSRNISPSEDLNLNDPEGHHDSSNNFRKPSAHSLFQFDNFSGRRHASFGAGDCSRPGAISSLSITTSSGRRSSSPHKMLFETSFCGSKPIPTYSMDMDSPPKEIDLDELRRKSQKFKVSPVTPDNRGVLSSDSSFESHRPLTTLATVQVHHQEPSGSSSSCQLDEQQQSIPPPLLDQPRRASWRSNSPESPKSSSHWRPYSPNPRGTQPVVLPPQSPQIDQDQPPPLPPKNPNMSKHYAKTPDSPFKPISPNRSQGSNISQGQPALEISPTQAFEAKWDTFQGLKNDEITNEIRIKEDPNVMVDASCLPLESKGLFQESSSMDEDEGDLLLPFVPNHPVEKPSAPPILPVSERKSSLFTTVPLERPKYSKPPTPASLNDYIAPKSSNNFTTTTLENSSSAEPSRVVDKDFKIKMKINLPRDDSECSSGGAGTPGSTQQTPKKRSMSTTNWSDFAELGLRSSPREIRQRQKEQEKSSGAEVQGDNNVNYATATDDCSSYHSDSSQDYDDDGDSGMPKSKRNAKPKKSAALLSSRIEKGGSRGINGGSDEEESECLLKLPQKVPFSNDLDVDRSLVSQECSPIPCEALDVKPAEEIDDEDDEDEEYNLT